MSAPRFAAASARRSRPRFRPVLECLEDRTVLSTLEQIPIFDPGLEQSASAGGVSQPAVSHDGRYIAYASFAPNLVPGQGNEAPVTNIYLYDTQNSTTRLISHVPGQAVIGADGPSSAPTISGDNRFVAFTSQATDLVPGQDGLQEGVRGLSNVFLYDIAADTNLLVSHASDAATTTGNDSSATVNATGFGFHQNTGRYLLFTSFATNLVAGQDSARHSNLFVYDTELRTTTLVSHAVDSPTLGGNDETYTADITEDGGFIVYASLAGNLVPNQTGQIGNAFLYDNRPSLFGSPNPGYRTSRLLSGAFDFGVNGPSSINGAGSVSNVLISADGSLVTWISSATNLVPFQSTTFDPFNGPYPPSPNVFAYSMTAGQTVLLSGAVSQTGPSASVTSNGQATRIAVNRDGTSVAFLSNASNLYPTQSGFPGQGRNSGNAFVARLSPFNPFQRSLVMASFDVDARFQTGGVFPAGGTVIRNTANFTDLTISADGRFVTYQAQQVAGVTGRLVPGQSGENLTWNSFVYDQASDVNALLSRVNGTQSTTGNFNTTAARISGTGFVIAFVSQATNLNPQSPSGAEPFARNGANLFVFPAFTQGPSLLSSRTLVQVKAVTLAYDTSRDGHFVVFTSNSPSVIADQVDTNADQDVFVYDRVSKKVELVSHVPFNPTRTGSAGSPGTTSGFQPPGSPVVISQDGNWIAFISEATDLVPGQVGIPQTSNIYLFDNRPGPTHGLVGLITHNATQPTQTGNLHSFNPVISADGSRIAFVSYATDIFYPPLIPGAFFRSNVFVFDLNTSIITILSNQDATPVTGNGNSSDPSISDDGRYIAFESSATNLLSGTTVAPIRNVYVSDMVLRQTTLVSHATSSATTSANDASFSPVLSADGRFLAYVSFATNLVGGQRVTRYSNVFVYDRTAGTSRLVSGVDGSATFSASGFSDTPVINSDGSIVAFRSSAPDVIAGQNNTAGSRSNVFRFNRLTASTTLVSHVAGAPTTTSAGSSRAPALDETGTLIVFVSTATNLVPGQQGGGVYNVFIHSFALRVNGLLSGLNGSPVVVSTRPTFLAIISRNPSSIFNGSQLGGVGGDIDGYVSPIRFEIAFTPQPLNDGSPLGTVAGILALVSVFGNQVLPWDPRLFPGEAADNGLFDIGPVRADGTYPMLTRFLVSYANKPTFNVSVRSNAVATAPQNITLSVNPPPPPGNRQTQVILEATGEAQVFRVTATPVEGLIPSGVVVLNDGGNRLGESALDGNGQAIFRPTLGPGQHALTAVYQGNNTFLAATSAVLTVQVGGAAGSAGQIQFNEGSRIVAERDGQLTLTLTRTGGSDGAVTVVVQTANGTALAGIDYGSISGPLTFGPGETTKTILIGLNNDGLIEEDEETFTIALQSVSGGATLGQPAGVVVSIRDDDLPALPDGPPPGTLKDAAIVFARSTEHYQQFVTLAYRRFLGREPDATGQTFWVMSMRDFGLTQERLEAGFLDSPEYLGRYGGQADGNWVRGIYKDLLDREADPSGLAYWSALLQQGVSAPQVALGFTASLERQTTRLRTTYQRLLGRDPDAGGLTYWIAFYQHGGTNEDIEAGFVGSPEYYANPAKGAGNIAKWVRRAYADVLFRNAGADEFAFWMRALAPLAAT